MEHKILKTLTHCPLFQGMAEEKIDRLLDSINNRLVSFDKHDIYGNYSPIGHDKFSSPK